MGTLVEVGWGPDPVAELEAALKAFRRALQRDGTAWEARRREHYQTPGERRREKVARARARVRSGDRRR